MVMKFGRTRISSALVFDISRGGLSCYFLDEKHPLPASFKIDIFSFDKVFHLADIPCVVVLEKPVTEEGVESGSLLRRVNLRFKHLTDKQSELLDYYLEKYTDQTGSTDPVTLKRY